MSVVYGRPMTGLMYLRLHSHLRECRPVRHDEYERSGEGQQTGVIDVFHDH